MKRMIYGAIVAACFLSFAGDAQAGRFRDRLRARFGGSGATTCTTCGPCQAAGAAPATAPAIPAAVPAAPAVIPAAFQSCPDGRCPLQSAPVRRGLFR